jgi:hypothetical protein
MGSLTPGATYIYERSEGIIYAREFGKTERRVVGYEQPKDYDPITGQKIDTIFGMDSRKVAELVAIAQTAESNSTLQEALERVKILYYLSKDNGSET